MILFHKIDNYKLQWQITNDNNESTGIVVYTFEYTDLSNENLYTRICVGKSIQGESYIDYCRKSNEVELKKIFNAHSELQNRNEMLRNSTKLKKRLNYLESVIVKFWNWYDIYKFDFPIAEPSLNEVSILNNHLRNANNLIKRLKNENRVLKTRASRPDVNTLRDLIDESRKKNGAANLTALGRLIGRHGDTAKRWIIESGLSDFAQLNR